MIKENTLNGNTQVERVVSTATNPITPVQNEGNRQEKTEQGKELCFGFITQRKENENLLRSKRRQLENIPSQSLQPQATGQCKHLNVYK